MFEFAIDYKFWGFVISVITLAGVILTAILNKLANDKMLNNHLHHIANDVKDIKTTQATQGTSIKNLELNMATLKGKQEIIEKFIKNSKVSRTNKGD
jgi:outer membrane murein-binding lipoprotein Lpp